MAPRVYVVDDDPVIRQLLEAVLQSGGYRVGTAAGGDEAIAGFEAFGPDVVVLDAMMPRTDGFAVCRAIRAASGDDGRSPYILMLTAAANEAMTAQAHDAGADEVMAKPFNPAAFLARLAEIAG